MAFALAGIDQLDQSYASRVVKPGGLAHLKLSVGVAAMEQASRTDADLQELEQFAGELREIADGIASLVVIRTEEAADEDEAAGVSAGRLVL